MAEKSGELENTNESDAIDSVSENQTDEFALTTAETTDIEASSTNETTDEEPEQIKAQIEETRAQMGETIDAIQEKLSFSNISEQVSEQINSAVETAKDAVYDATIGKAGKFMTNFSNEISKTTVIRSARENPLPFLLIGLGVGLLAYNGFGGGKRRSNGGNGGFKKYLPSEVPGKAALKSAGDKIGGVASTVGGAASTAYGSVSGAASTAIGGVSNAATTAYEGVGNFAGTAYEKAGEYGTQAREQYDYYIEENPLAVGAVALALGAAVGFSIPSTSYEGELMGEARHNLLQKAQDTAGELVDKVKQVASEAQKTIGDEVKTAVNEVKSQSANQ
jgi:phage-related protein